MTHDSMTTGPNAPKGMAMTVEMTPNKNRMSFGPFSSVGRPPQPQHQNEREEQAADQRRPGCA